MLNRILVIDDSITVEYMLKYCSKHRWPDLIIELYDPKCNLPDKRFAWERYDLLMLDYDLGLDDENGLDWLIVLRKQKNIPPIVMLTGYATDKLDIAAKKLGAEIIIDKNELQPVKFVAAIEELFQRKNKGFEKTQLMTAEEMSLIKQKDKIPGSEVNAEFEKTQLVVSELDKITKENKEESTDVSSRSITTRSSKTSPHGKQSADIPFIVPGYNLTRKIGEGGMASIYLADRDEDEKKVVLKVLTLEGSDDTLLLRRFMREYKLIAQIHHPNIVQIFERAFASNFAYIAMEYFEHGDLAEKLKTVLDAKTSIKYLMQITMGLQAAHEKGIVHRDMKPANILFRDDDNLAITDFGIAKSIENENFLQKELTLDGELMGTIYYMSPEQIEGLDADKRSDLYSLGVIMYKMLTGKHPYVGSTPMEVLDKHLHAPIPVLPDEFKSLQPLLNGLLEKDPDERFQSTEDLLIGLDWDIWF